LDRHAGALLAAQDDLALRQQRSGVFESDLISSGEFFLASTCPAIAAAGGRTPEKVKLSAMMPRQPDVPK